MSLFVEDGPGIRVEAPVMEVFASIQGEGLYAGDPQVFLRLFGCPLRCRYCDTPGSWSVQAEARARIAGPGATRREAAGVTPFQAACWIAEVEPGAPRTVSVTGGEPLIWPGFVLGLRDVIGERRLHLETAGGHPAALERVLGVVDHVSLDLKLPADLDAPEAVGLPQGGEPSPRNEVDWARARSAALELVRGRDACGKLVLTGERDAEEFTPLLEDVRRLAPDLPLFIQPATPMGAATAPEPELITELLEAARDRHLRVRVLPQIHRALRIP